MQRIMDAKSFRGRLKHSVYILGAKLELVTAKLESYYDSLF